MLQRSVIAACLCWFAGQPARGQCVPSWSDGRTGGVGGSVRALCAVDSSCGVARGLYVGGTFPSAGPIAASNVAAWSGHSWAPLGLGTNSAVLSLTVHDADGDGPTRARLIAGGTFTVAGTAPASRIASWDGTAWSPLGGGLNGPVNALASFDADGAGAGAPMLFVAGQFTMADGQAAKNLAMWDGVNWSAAGDTDNEVVSLASLSGGLYTGGWFTLIGGTAASRVARWDGVSWSAIGAGLGGPFPILGQCFALFDEDGGGSEAPALFVGGYFLNAGSVQTLGFARWDGADWSGVAGGIGYPAEARSAVVLDDDGDGPGGARLFVVGNYAPVVGGPGLHAAAWDGSSWTSLGSGLDMAAWSAAVFDDDGDGPDPAALYVGGEFVQVDGLAILHLARWGCPRTTPPPCADMTGDGFVSFADITQVLANFGVDYRPLTGTGDANGDGVVTFADVTAVLSAWGMVCP
ncbi:MAG: hypothetical protein JNK58_04605 [Phycisphaerae bacterium]|nr:hypothetical protein [Phycisphaerae bacterium]